MMTTALRLTLLAAALASGCATAPTPAVAPSPDPQTPTSWVGQTVAEAKALAGDRNLRVCYEEPDCVMTDDFVVGRITLFTPAADDTGSVTRVEVEEDGGTTLTAIE